MACFPLLLYLSLLLHTELATHPPAPVNLTMDSVNFRHILRWDPGPGTPPGTVYCVYKSRNSKMNKPKQTAGTIMRMKLKESMDVYYLSVKASYNQTWSKPANLTFVPFRQTKLGPPELSLAAHGNSIQINISMPQPPKESQVDDIQKFYGGQFKVSYRNEKDGKIMKVLTENKTMTLENLNRGVEYCVQVKLHITMNKNHGPSAWKCVITTSEDPKRGLVLAAVVNIPVLVIFVLAICILFLSYTGFLCKLKEALPRPLLTTKGYTMTPEWTIPDPIVITSGPGVLSSSATSRLCNGDADSEEDDDDEMNYVNRGTGLSSGESSCQDFENVSRDSKLLARAAEDSGGSRLPTEVMAPPAELEEDELDAEGGELVLVHESPRTGVSGRIVGEEEDKEVVRDTSGNVNLFSVTLASLAVGNEEEEEEETDCMKVSGVQVLPTDSQTEPGDQAAEGLMTHSDSPASGYEVRRVDEDEEDEDEDEEEECSAYLRNR